MKEISLRAKLDEQRAANPKRYQKLEELINLQRPDRYDQLTNTSIESYRHLRSAGFPSDSLLDQLTAGQIKRLAKALQLDASRVFLREDINELVYTYGLCFFATNYYRGQAWEEMEKDLQSFQQQILTGENPMWYESYYSVLGVSPALSGYPTPASRIPLLFFHLGSDLYFLISTYDSWVPGIRRILYWPFATFRQGAISYTVGLASYFFLVWIIPKDIFRWVGIPLVLFSLTAFFTAMSVSLLRRRDYPNAFPLWLNRLIYRWLPY